MLFIKIEPKDEFGNSELDSYNSFLVQIQAIKIYSENCIAKYIPIFDETTEIVIISPKTNHIIDFVVEIMIETTPCSFANF
eukprot:snap_masked-scaffold_57-processed-gene-0.8-mRNA-1 protein AED:1.00 eAED:1.00 QI:0/-1/0/0/-1/1/1/0/80